MTEQTTTRSERTQAFARRYLEKGIAIFALPPKRKKANLDDWPNTTVKLEDVDETFDDGQGIAGIMGERSGNIAAVDCDCSEAVALAGRYLDPTTTAGHGENLEAHWYYYTVESEAGYQKFTELNSPKALVELRGDSGHYMALPPTIHPDDGEEYRFKNSGLGMVRINPDELRHRTRMLATASLIARHLPKHRRAGGGGRHDFALALSGLMLRGGRLEPADVLAVLKGGWDCDGWPTERDRREGHADLEGIVDDTSRKLAQGEKVKGGRELNKMLPGMASKIGDYWKWSEQTEGKRDKNAEPPTHDVLRDRWLESNPDYAHGLGEWRRYRGGIYAVAKQPTVEASIMRTLEASKSEGIKPNGFVLSSVHKLARIEAYVDDEAWDADPNILVAENGCVDLASGNLLPHSPQHRATTRVPYAFDPNAKAPQWHTFIGDLDKDIAAFLQEFAGYCLTIWTHLEKAIWLVGPPGGGKSTVLEGLIAMLGDRAGVLGLAEIEKSHFAVAKLVGKTLVTAAEQPAGFVSCHHILNAIISGELIQIERKYRDPYDLAPRAKIAWAMNETPRIPSGAEGLFRRVEVIRFPRISENDQDPELKTGIKEEGAGVLNWALEGLARLRKRGNFAVPETVEKASEEFRQNNDIPALFVADQCITESSATEKSSDLYKEYKFWCEENGHRAKSSTSVADDWQRLGFERYRSMGTTRYRGLRVKLPSE